MPCENGIKRGDHRCNQRKLNAAIRAANEFVLLMEVDLDPSHRDLARGYLKALQEVNAVLLAHEEDEYRETWHTTAWEPPPQLKLAAAFDTFLCSREALVEAVRGVIYAENNLLRKEEASTPSPGMARSHQQAAAPLHRLIIISLGLLALAAIGTGAYSLFRGSAGHTEFVLLGSHLSTSNVGVALVGLGLMIAFFTVRSVLKNIAELARLPPDEVPRRRRRR